MEHAPAAWAAFFREPQRLPAGLKRVLVIDDKKPFPQLAARCFEPKVKVQSATGGEEGVALARALLPDLILVDWVMSEMSGEEVVRRLRQDPATRSIPTVLVSGYLDPDDSREALRARAAGADLFLTKDQVQVLMLTYRQDNFSRRSGPTAFSSSTTMKVCMTSSAMS